MLTPFGVGVSKFVWVLGRPVLTIDSTHVSLFFRLSGCHLRARYIICVITMMFSLKMYYEKIIYVIGGGVCCGGGICAGAC